LIDVSCIPDGIGGNMAITPANKEKLKSRLAKAIGHLNAVHRMVDEQKYCIDVLNQLKAVQAALDKTAEVILRQHLETCVVEAVNKQDSHRVIEELMQVFRQAPSLYAADDDIQDILPTNAANQVPSKPGGCCH
jgi:CsoR family transcriptional regulator, copper-sensing transcriptional repressor